MGKYISFHLLNHNSTHLFVICFWAQLYCEKEKLTEHQFEQLKGLVDIGDILGAIGTLKRTEKGELLISIKLIQI